MGEGAAVEKKKPTSCQNFPFHHPLAPPFLTEQNFRILSIFVRNDPTFRLVCPICPNIDPSRTVASVEQAFPTHEKSCNTKIWNLKQAWLLWTWFKPQTSWWPQLPQFVKKKNPARSRGLVQTRTWPPVLAILLSEPGSELASAQQAILSVRPPTSGTKITQICLILPKTFMGIIPGPTFGETSVNLEPDLSPLAH